MSKGSPKNHKKIPQHSCCSMLTWEKKMKAIRGNGYRFAPKVGVFPTETIMLVVRSSGLWEAYTQTCPKLDKKFTMTCWCRSMIACQVSWISEKFWITRIKKPGISMFAAEWWFHCVWHSFPFLARDLSMHPRTKDFIFTPIYMHGSMCK